jgi:hypothetical protein
MALGSGAAPNTPTWHLAPRASATSVSSARRGGKPCTLRGTASPGAAGPSQLAAATPPLGAPPAHLWRQPEASWPQRGHKLRRLGRATTSCSSESYGHRATIFTHAGDGTRHAAEREQHLEKVRRKGWLPRLKNERSLC